MAATVHPGRFNVFQRAMLQWNSLHPYHAIHVIRWPGAPDVERLRAIMNSRLVTCGLGGLNLDLTRGEFSYDGQPIATDIRVVSPDGRPEEAFSHEVEWQLNHRFETGGRFNPFRLFILAEENSFLLGLTYFHPMADAESVAVLMRKLAEDYASGAVRDAGAPMECHPPRPDRLLRSKLPVLMRKLLALPGIFRAMRHAYRAPLRDAEDLENRFRLMTVEPKTLQRMLGTARGWGVTLHDLLLALLMRALSPLAPERHQAPRRRNIALGTIANVRREHGIDSERTFGLFLGSFAVTHPVGPGISLRELATDLSRQTRRIKHGRLYLASHLELRLATRLFTLYSHARQKKFYHKNHPLWGGITNMNLDNLWKAEHPARPRDYFRVVSTGLVTPLVLAATTFDGHMKIGLTYRPGLFTAREIDTVQAELVRQLEELEVDA